VNVLGITVHSLHLLIFPSFRRLASDVDMPGTASLRSLEPKPSSPDWLVELRIVATTKIRFLVGANYGVDFQKILSPVNPGFVGANYGVDFKKKSSRQ
jgi:hypothetical protein